MTSVTVGNSGLCIDNRTVPVYSGTVHYWRLERDLWPKILDRVIELGFRMVETYVPWSTHEISPGVYDWGETDPRKDFEAFTRLCEEKDLWLLVRPGPLINAELTDFGFPEWVLLDPEVQAKSSTGSLHFDAAWGLHPPRPFPVPSYASEKFFSLVGGWFDQVCPIIARHQAPDGCIVAVQSDNESCYLFHDQPYATDYSDASLDLYRKFLANEYGTIQRLNAAYGTAHRTFEESDPPGDSAISSASDLPFHLDWVKYKEFQILWSVGRFAQMLKERGIDQVPLFHDIAWQIVTPLDVSRMEAHPDIDWVGMNLYCNKEEYHTAARRIRFLAGATRLPFVPEFGCGLWSHHRKTFTPDEHEFITLTAFMHGMRAVNFYMLVERERWQGSAITRHGEFRPEYADFYARLGEFLRRYPLWEFERDRQTLIMLAFDGSRHARMTTTLNLAHADLLGLPRHAFELDDQLGLVWNPQSETDFNNPDTWVSTAMRTLAASGVGFDIADTHIDREQLQRYPMICLQAFDFMDSLDQESLLGYVEDGGALIIGPGMPHLDPNLRPAKVIGHYIDQPGETQLGSGRIAWTDTAGLGASLQLMAPASEFRLASGPAEMTVMRRGDETLLFLANPEENQTRCQVEFNGSRKFREVWITDGCFEGDGKIEFLLEPYSIRIFAIEGRS